MENRLELISTVLFFSSLRDSGSTLKRLEEVVNVTCSASESLLPSVLTGMLGAMTHIVQFIRDHELSGNLIDT